MNSNEKVGSATDEVTLESVAEVNPGDCDHANAEKIGEWQEEGADGDVMRCSDCLYSWEVR